SARKSAGLPRPGFLPRLHLAPHRGTHAGFLACLASTRGSCRPQASPPSSATGSRPSRCSGIATRRPARREKRIFANVPLPPDVASQRELRLLSLPLWAFGICQPSQAPFGRAVPVFRQPPHTSCHLTGKHCGTDDKKSRGAHGSGETESNSGE